MRKLKKPSRNARSTILLCAKSIRDGQLSKRLISAAPDVEKAEAEYVEKGEISQLFSIAPAKTIANKVTKAEMERIYKGTFSRKTSSIRYIYDEIKLAPINSICPLCATRVVATLDHYLPKSCHPSFAVTPINLVPACSDCNKLKLDMQPGDASEQTLHPYFDDSDSEPWLTATIEKDPQLAILFSAVPPETWPKVTRERIINHFKIFKLGGLYSSKAGVELTGIRHYLMVIAERDGRTGIYRHLKEQAESWDAVSKNTWQGAMYKALKQSDWFCDGGYESIPSP